jgi:1-acyl-sn-glycerol-3-phosphate acyltransferase
VKKNFATWLLRSAGWRWEGTQPRSKKCVIVAAPHTSNWDMPLMLAYAWRYDLSPHFMMKHTAFAGPFGSLFRKLGGIAIDRRSRGNVVEQMAEAFEGHDELALVIPPEGTRQRVDVWKSGFYHIARMAGVPLVLSYLDYAERVGGFGPEFMPTGDLPRDMDVIRDFYTGRSGRFPDGFGEIRLPEEAEQPAA